MPFVVSPELEAPGPIAQVGANDQPGMSEIIEVPKQRHAVVALSVQRLDEVPVADRCFRVLQDLEDRKPWSRRAETCPAYHRLEGFQARFRTFPFHARNVA